jgi:uncharacterized protein YdeI (YjbR/CyaY-like superfamily)
VNHASETELWVRISKKASGQPSVTWDDGVVVAICWGWIDGLRKALDDTSFLQRLTPRRTQRWALGQCLRRQRHHGDARRLFLAALRNDPATHAFYATLKCQSQFTIYHRLHSAKRSDTRQKRMAELLAKLARGEIP